MACTRICRDQCHTLVVPVGYWDACYMNNNYVEAVGMSMVQDIGTSSQMHICMIGLIVTVSMDYEYAIDLI